MRDAILDAEPRQLFAFTAFAKVHREYGPGIIFEQWDPIFVLDSMRTTEIYNVSNEHGLVAERQDASNRPNNRLAESLVEEQFRFHAAVTGRPK